MSTILLIETDKILASNIQKFLKRHGHKVTWHTSAQGGIDLADRQRPDAVVLDLQLAGHSGVEFLHELRSYGDWQNIPVVVFSAIHPDSLGGEVEAKTSLTISAYIHKPTATLAKLTEAIERSIKQATR